MTILSHAMILLKGDEIRLKNGQIVEVIDTWGIARCHVKVKDRNGKEILIIAERDVAEILRRRAIQRIT